MNPATIEHSITLAQSNALTNARYNFTLFQKRFLYYIIKEVRRLYIETNEGNRTLWQNLYIQLRPEQLRECGNASLVFKEAAELRGKTIYINRGGEEVAVGWINYVKRDKKTGVYEVEVSKEIMPELVELAERFHTYELTVALTLKSVYSQRLYELCSQYKNYQDGHFNRKMDELHRIFEVPESYKNFGIFKARVLEPARKEIKSLYDEGTSDLYFEYYEYEKKGKKVLSVGFKVITREREKLKSYKPEDAIFFVRSNLNPLFRRDKRFVERVVKAIQLNPDIGYSIVQKLSEKMDKYPQKDQPAIIRYVLSEDFDIK